MQKERHSILRYWPIPVIFFLYHLINVNYSALTYPFWDHLETGRVIIKSFEGSLTWGDLWAPHNHSRPLLLRLVFIANAHLTNWDVRSEFILSLFTVGLQLISLFLLLNRFTQCSTLRHSVVLLILFSALICSPAAHNNHWWSFMLQLQGASLFSIWAISSFSFSGSAVLMHLLSICLVWAAALFISNGIFLHAVCSTAAVLLLPTNRRGFALRLLWITSLIILVTVYIPGVESSSSGGAPTVLQFLQFVTLYIGMPIGQLLWFQFEDMFSSPRLLWPNLGAGVAGFVALGLTLIELWKNHTGSLLSRVCSVLSSPRSRFAAICIGYSLLSAAATAWGRITFDETGVYNANASRYAVFSLYYWIGLGLLASQLRLPTKLIFPVAAIFTCLTANSYYRAERIYSAGHNFNIALGQAYSCPVGGEELANRVFPKTSLVPAFKWSLFKNGLGPYNHHFPAIRELLSSISKFADTSALSSKPIKINLIPRRDRLVGVHIQAVTFKNTSSSYQCDWTLSNAVLESGKLPLRSGSFNTRVLRDWHYLHLYFEPLDYQAKELLLTLSCQTGPNTGQLAALPLFEVDPLQNDRPTGQIESNRNWNITLEYLPC